MRFLRRFTLSHKGLMLALFVLALLVRAVVPSGWMPLAVEGSVRVTLCSGGGTVAAWIGKDGTVHKDDPSKSDQNGSPCAFSGLGLAGALVDSPEQQQLAPFAETRLGHAFPRAISVGLGLAAPPPAKTGPPILT